MVVADYALTTFSGVQLFLGTKAYPSSDQARVEAIINAVSKAFNREAGRDFYHREAISKDVPGHGTPELLLGESPVTSVASLTFIGPVVGLSSFTIDTSEVQIKSKSGILWREAGWTWTTPNHYAVELRAQLGSEGPLWRVVFNAGYRSRKQSEAGTAFTDTVEDLPPDIELSVIQSVARVAKRLGTDMDISSKTDSEGSTVNFRPLDSFNPPNLLLPETLRMARSYQLPTL